MWRDREPTDREVKAVTVLQAGFRGHLVREILDASKPGKQLNVHARTHREYNNNIKESGVIQSSSFKSI